MPAPPFNIMLIAHTFKSLSDGPVRGRWAAWTAIVIGVLTFALVLGALIYGAMADPKIVYCDHDAAAVCLSAPAPGK